MAGIYIHLPFCQNKCGYCDFYSIIAESDEIEHYVRLLCEEMKLREAAFPYSIQTVYLGGGTPSLIPAASLSLLLDRLRQIFKVSVHAEITIEVNPGTVGPDIWTQFMSAGMNRISLGVQSFHDNELKMLGRIHQSRDAINAFNNAREAGFKNIGIDLIYGLPGQIQSSWEATLKEAIAMGPDHISTYALSLSEHVPMAEQIRKKIVPPLDEDLSASFMEMAHDILVRAGYEHYEISNFAKPGFWCRHNLMYWQGEPYMGIGASAHSFEVRRRWWNVADIAGYQASIEKGHLPIAGEEELNQVELELEKIALGLRTLSGVPLSRISHAKQMVDQLIQEGKAMVENGCLVLTPSGFLVADEIAVQLAQ